MNPFTALFASLFDPATLSPRLARAAAFAGALLTATPQGQNVNWRSVGLAALAGLFGAGEMNQTTPPKV